MRARRRGLDSVLRGRRPQCDPVRRASLYAVLFLLEIACLADSIDAFPWGSSHAGQRSVQRMEAGWRNRSESIYHLYSAIAHRQVHRAGCGGRSGKKRGTCQANGGSGLASHSGFPFRDGLPVAGPLRRALSVYRFGRDGWEAETGSRRFLCRSVRPASADSLPRTRNDQKRNQLHFDTERAQLP